MNKPFWLQRPSEEARNVIAFFVKLTFAFLFGFLFLPILFAGGLR